MLTEAAGFPWIENGVGLTGLGFHSRYKAEYDCKSWRNGKDRRKEGIN